MENETGKGTIRAGRKDATGGETRPMTPEEIYKLNKEKTERRELIKSQGTPLPQKGLIKLATKVGEKIKSLLKTTGKNKNGGKGTMSIKTEKAHELADKYSRDMPSGRRW